MAQRPTSAPHAIVSSSGKVYSPLSRPGTASSSRVFWRPSSSSTSRSSTSALDEFKRVPRNPRYEHVQPKTQTGSSVKKIEEQLGSSAVRFKRTENFKRIRASKLAELMTRPDGNDNVLLLDVRDKAEYASFRIKGAVSYPSSMMSRSMYQFTPEILKFKNAPGRLIILYDLEEKLSTSVGINWFEKGIDNFAILSGGISALSKVNPELIQGEGLSNVIDESFTSKTSTLSISSTCTRRPQTAGRSSIAASPLSVPTPIRRDIQASHDFGATYGGNGGTPASLSRDASVESSASQRSRSSAPVPQVRAEQNKPRAWLAQDKMYSG